MKVSSLLLAALLSTGFGVHAKTPDGKPLVVFIAGKPSHGPGEHEHNAGVQLLAKSLGQGAPGVATKVHLNAEWPSAEELAQADTVVIYSDGQGGHAALVEDRLAALKQAMDRGAGLVCLHYAVEPIFEATGWAGPQKGPDGKALKLELPPGRGSKGKGSPELLEWLGGYFEQFWSVNPHWTADFKELPKHLISTGVKPFSTNDEWYFYMRFRGGMKGVTPILSAIAPPETMNRPEGDHGGNPDVKRSVLEDKAPQHVAWTSERENGGRGFGFTGGHYHKGWANDDQRKLVLNAILWTAKADMPQNGVESKLTAEDLSANLDPKTPKKPAAPPAKPAAAATPPAPPVANADRYGLAAAKKNAATFTTPPGLQASLVAAEPMIQNPTSIDIDPRGRIWATECVNYRKYMDLRADGDRVVIMEDTDGDGLTDRAKTFFQSPDLTNPLGICVLPQAKGTKVIVSAAPNVWLLTDEDGDDVAEEARVIFKIGGVWNYDHQIHAFSFGFDGKLYFNAGNSITELTWPDGTVVKDLSGHEIRADGKPYRQGMVFRCDLDLATGKASNVETLGWNFRNNYKAVVDSFGTIWQSDNDDDGNKGVRINYVMEYGNYGYQDEMTGAGWRTARTNLENEIPLQHWHLNDPGVVPNLLQTGAGSPTGMIVNEGSALGPQFANQIIHCDAGPRTVRAYPVEKDGAGYQATMVDLLTSTDNWYRPSDVAIAPDGSLVISDWYDPGVGGHLMGDNQAGKIMGRIYRVASTGGTAKAPTPDFTTAEGAAAALQSPNRATAYAAWQALHTMGAKAEPAVEKLATHQNPRFRARAVGLLANGPSATKALRAALNDVDSDVRIAAIRLCSTLYRSKQLDTTPLHDDRALVGKLIRDPSPQVRRQIAISLSQTKKIDQLWTGLAQQYDGKDRWYLEALGIGAMGNEDACFETWLAAVGEQWNTPAGRDIVWRTRAAQTAQYLAKIVADQKVAAIDKPRFFRSFDFLPATPQKTEALTQLASLDGAADEITREALARLKGTDLNSDPKLAAALKRTLDRAKGTPQFIGLVRDFRASGQSPALLETALAIGADPAAVDAIKLVLADRDADQIIADAIAGPKADAVLALIGSTSTPQGTAILARLAADAQKPIAARQPAIRALARTQPGAEALLKLARNHQLTPELTASAGSALRMVQFAALQKDIDQIFPAPASLDGKKLPPIAELVKLSGDVAKGRAIFERAESSCVSCHRVNDKGVDFAPALSEIGTKLAKEALYDSIINPNAGVTMGFETTQIALKDGGAGLGIVRSETGDELVLALPGGVATKFRKSDITKREKLATSLMPSGLNQALTQDDLVHLVEYLASLKKK